MDHMQFKANQTAAAYVAHELDEHTQEAFEVHMMGCSECLNDVEAWRVIKTHMPDAVVLGRAGLEKIGPTFDHSPSKLGPVVGVSVD